jgi:hypothetical protein
MVVRDFADFMTRSQAAGNKSKTTAWARSVSASSAPERAKLAA